VNLIPPHVASQHFDTLHDPRDTLDQKGLPIGGYIRISTKKESQISSIENQKKLLREWAEVSNYNLVRFYIDIKSGEFTYLRNEMIQLIDDIREQRIKGVVCKELSRTSRDVMDILELKREIASYGGFLISIKEGYDSRTDDDEFLLVLHGALAQKERKTIASRVKVTQILKAKEGKTNVPHPAYGYMLSEDRQHLVVNPETAPIYRFIVERFLDGWGQLKIAKYLNKKGIPSKRGGKWHTSSIRTILTNPVYLGVTIYNTTTLVRTPSGKQKRVMRPRDEWIIRENTHEPLITREEFEKIQAIVKERKERDTKEWSCDRKYLGSSILRCSECGGKIFGTRFPKKRGGKKVPGAYYYRYICQNRLGACTSPMKMWDMARVDRIIMDLVAGLFSDRARLMEAVRKQIELLSEDDAAGHERERTDVREKMQNIKKAIKKQQLAFENDVITLDEYKERMIELRREMQLLELTLARLDEELQRSDVALERINRVYEKVIEKLEDIHNLPYEEKIELVTAAFDSIYLDKDYNITDVIFKI